MDFVDLDKVLDEFEEEEKQALSIIPGQELRPSGYLEFLEKHQEQEWALINPSKFPSTSGYTLERRSAREPANVSYDDPYDSLPAYKFGCVTSDQLSSVPYKRYVSLPEGKQRRNQSAIVTSLTRISVHDEDVNTVYTTPAKVPERKGIANCSERKGTIAYHPIEVQTDALSPASEKELMLSPFPKSDILVDGHGDTSVVAEQVCYSEIEQNQSTSYSGAAESSESIQQLTKVGVHAEDENQRSQSAIRNLEVVADSYSSLQPNLYSLAGTYSQINSGFLLSENSDMVPSTTSLFDPNSLVVSAGDTSMGYPQSEQIVCFNDLVDEDFDNDEINAYLNILQGQRVTNVNTSETPAPVNSVILEPVAAGEPHNEFTDKNTSHVTGSSLSHEEFSARVISKLDLGDGNISVFDSSCRNSSHIHINDTDNLCIEPRDRTTSDVVCTVKNISDSEPSNHLQDASQTLYNSLITGKMEIENILDDIINTESVTNNIRDNMMLERMEDENVKIETSSVVNSEQVLCGRMEIENILDEVFLKQQSMLEQISQNLDLNSNLNYLHSDVEHGSDNIQDRPCETALAVSDSDSSSPVRSFGQNYEMGNSMAAVGVGARPKDLSVFKKNRSNASLGLSKDSPEIPTDVKPKVARDLDDNTFHKQVVEQFPDSSVQFPQLADNDHPSVLLLDSESLGNAELRPNDFTAVEPEDKPVLHDFSEPCSQPEYSQSINQSLAAADGFDASQTAGVLNTKRPSSLDLPSQSEAEEQDQNAEHTASAETTDRTSEESADAKSAMYASDIQDNLGHVAPFWIPDTDALTCMICQTKFTIWKRRHHCRACGKVLCAVCCNQKAVLPYMDNKEARVCIECHIQLNLVPGTGTSPRYPNPNNPFEYCSKVPPNQQVSGHANPPVVMVPAGVLRSSGGQKRFGEPKQVIFSDGVRPGGDLATLDDTQHAGQTADTSRATKTSQQQLSQSQSAHKQKSDGVTRNQSLIPGEGLPPLLVMQKDLDSTETDTPVIQTDYVADFKSEEGPLLMFAVNRNLSVGVRIINLDCCLNRVCWCFVTLGMDTVGESELVVLLELTEEELASPSPRPSRAMFLHLQAVYEEALKGDVIKDMGHYIFQYNNMGNTEYSGFFFLKPTFQCLNKIPLPEQPYMFGILIQKYELPWARVFPLRLMLRLGAEYKYYPCPLISIRDRKPVFFEIGHTIINLLADFRSYQYMLPQIKGVTIHMENKKTVISLPRNQYNDIMKAVRSSNEHVMALGSSFSTEADSHLVCIQSEDGTYQTQAINIQDKPRLVTGASFVIFNGALKLSSGLRAKSSIVEDGLMVQVLPDALASIKEAIKNTTDYTVQCGLLDAATSEEVVELRWVDPDRHSNIGVKSYIDGAPLEVVDMTTIKPLAEYPGDNLAIRWTRVYFLQRQNSAPHSDSINMNQLMEDIAHACCSALVKHLDELKKEGRVKLGLRVNLTRDSIGYEIGSKGQSLPVALLNTLDTFLIPVIHLALQEGVLMEFIFNIVD
ncbi:hypothetical protein BsWGS_19806 [Bradybaena similaris]